MSQKPVPEATGVTWEKYRTVVGRAWFGGGGGGVRGRGGERPAGARAVLSGRRRRRREGLDDWVKSSRKVLTSRILSLRIRVQVFEDIEAGVEVGPDSEFWTAVFWGVEIP
jgi:hypothetical protein